MYRGLGIEMMFEAGSPLKLEKHEICFIPTMNEYIFNAGNLSGPGESTQHKGGPGESTRHKHQVPYSRFCHRLYLSANLTSSSMYILIYS